ncbi:uncharacterized protein LOC127882343 isoform X2 [Dreissena polymorpha]|nr:uncharacterized protein LOC127882343 isoform X2 [Dreissena polymorpha]XP_052286882.1 uncharacterized protein LOC127882343 isoform X2 [Dreissena polymorpha]XP_052286883.1 uncharacterized protein LOC127882343 isoform X2 [Dreissena polymorpha]XP_052286884.1 uncharacterized protein LOC127882343 isoform X2 [Dreissena polymorpha]
MLRVALCVVILVAAVHCMPTEIEAKAKCGSTFKLTLEEDFRVISKAVVDTNDTCTFKFTSENTGDCKGTCYMFDHYAEIRDDKVALIVGKKTYLTGSNFPNTPVCSDDVTVDVTLIHASGYMHNTTYPNYKFKLNVYNKCGPKGEQYNLTFEDVISELDGYHHGEEKESRQRNVFIAGVLVGVGLASCFLIMVAVTYCFMRENSNRRSNSKAIPKPDGKQKFTPGQQPVEVEMGVAYKATDPDKVAAKPLLSDKVGEAANKGAYTTNISSNYIVP